VKQSTIAVTSVINWSTEVFFYYISWFSIFFKAILSILKVAWQYVISSQ